MGNSIRPELSTHHATTWDWQAVTDPIQCSVFENLEEQTFTANIMIPFGHGVCREDVKLFVRNHTLHLFGRKPLDKDITSGTLKKLFARYPTITSFERSLTLPIYVDAHSTEAHWVRDGHLQVKFKRFNNPQQRLLSVGAEEDEREVEIRDIPLLTDPRSEIPLLKNDKESQLVSVSPPEDAKLDEEKLEHYGEEKLHHDEPSAKHKSRSSASGKGQRATEPSSTKTAEVQTSTKTKQSGQQKKKSKKSK